MEGGIPAETLISQQPKAIESRNWYQIIAMTIFYNHVMIYINTLTFFFTQIFKDRVSVPGGQNTGKTQVMHR